MFVNFPKNSFFSPFLSSFSVNTSDERKLFKKRFVKYFLFSQVFPGLSFFFRSTFIGFISSTESTFFYHFFVVFFTYHLARTLDFLFIFSHFPPTFFFFWFCQIRFSYLSLHSILALQRVLLFFWLFLTFLKVSQDSLHFSKEFIKHIKILFFTRVFFLTTDNPWFSMQDVQSPKFLNHKL